MAKTLGFVTMLDVSTSMREALDMVKIDAKAFIHAASPGDRFAVNAFSSQAFWVYPTESPPRLSDISCDLYELLQATREIEKLKVIGVTNIGEAIRLGNQVIRDAGTDLQAFVLLSDGAHNTGPRPATVLGSEPPLYVAGLGDAKGSYFAELLQKNPKSTFYYQPQADRMAEIFHQIKADAGESLLLLNDFSAYRAGSDYLLREFTVASKENDTQLIIVWSDKAYRYVETTTFPDSHSINIVLIDPHGVHTAAKSSVAGDGYCVYNLGHIEPGRWKVLFQYKIEKAIRGTLGVFDRAPRALPQVTAPAVCAVGEELRIQVRLSGLPLTNPSVEADISRPLITWREALEKYRNELPQATGMEDAEEESYRLSLLRARLLRERGFDILERERRYRALAPAGEGCYVLAAETPERPGIYTYRLNIRGMDGETGLPFSCVKTAAVIVTE